MILVDTSIWIDHLRADNTVLANDPEVLSFINHHALFGRGVGYVDAHLLAAVRLTAGGLIERNFKCRAGSCARTARL